MTVDPASEPVGTNTAGAEELADLRVMVREFLTEHSGEEAVRKIADDPDRLGYDPQVWSQMAEQLGLMQLALPEKFGGDGFGFPELRVVLEEMGAALLCSPFVSSVVLAAQSLLASGDELACARYLPGIGAGTTIATLAVAEEAGSWDADASETAAVPDDAGGWRVSGTKSFVPHAGTADLLLVAARTPQGPSLFAVERGAGGLAVRALETLDGTRPLGEVVLADTPAVLVGAPGGAAEGVRRAVDLGALALAAEQVGGLRRCLDISVAYAKERVQFGRSIGSFQAIKHKLADMLVRAELADAATEAACTAVAEGRPDSMSAAVAAYITASEAFEYIAAETIQVHGGIGFTWEHPAHLYFRRARAAQNLLGGPTAAHHRLLERMGV
ncbi:acyl-CoA/acyl-ACP dehydrogenase [Nocardia zapadnayensis]|uniref:acyl-CoA dehydrogenase family protein n=1 Tax=Nocardia rhamnosiphila TaxID=426716 RepID=UPI0022455CC3|nr:acyl-CoA dehydrogenase family protein [Nocardia zapadnayensis]MCX0272797.1 acyl-CoA/acyl-ACP dehydrogenase [Nocardia zapadnayensis]